jgi:hypothetical protein
VTGAGVQADPRTVREVLTEDHYRVPAYQRNYAWGEEEIWQLIDDLLDAATDKTTGEYFLGNIVVSASQGSAENPFSVVDGQQRLTTLHLLFKYLDAPGGRFALHSLTFESRPRAARSFDLLGTPADGDIDPGITTGFRIISQYAKTAELARHLDYVLDKVLVVRLRLPEATDLNRYFEVMNTRGEQLQQQDIVKARLMARLPDDERSTFAWIWDACTRMDTYVQMALTPGDLELRGRLFGPDWACLQAPSFGDLLKTRGALSMSARGFGAAGGSLADAIGAYAADRAKQDADADEPERFSSVIEFPTFLLHVLRIAEGGEPGEDETQLDDKKLVKRFQTWLESPDPAERVRNFAFKMLRCRFLFDTLVLKREFTSRTGDDGIWSLKRLVKGFSNRNPTPRYVGSFPLGRTPDAETESAGDADGSKRVRLLESALRVTYTSPRTMHWITAVLRYAFDTGSSQLSAEGLLAVLQRLVRAKVADVYDTSGTFAASGFDIPRIVFTYLDYLLADRAGQLDFQFTFRNSVEHFYPQHPDGEIERAYGALSDPGDRDLLGNLALLTVRDNSKFTNNPPALKALDSRVVAQSPKLRQMAEVARRDHRAWDSAAIRKHHKDMLKLLREDLFVGG